MLKIQNLFLLIFLSISLNNIWGMEHSLTQQEVSEETQELINTFYGQLMKLVRTCDFDGIIKVVKKMQEHKIDLNTTIGYRKRPFLCYLIRKFLNTHDKQDFILKAIKYFIDNGANPNADYKKHKFTPLEKVINNLSLTALILDSVSDEQASGLHYKLIILLLNYGAHITETAKKLAAKCKSYEQGMLLLFINHEGLIQQAQTNPTQELLNEAILNNKPYIVELIVQYKPELITQETIALVDRENPYLAKSLKQIFAIQKFKASELGQRLPHELAQYIGQFVKFQKQSTFNLKQ